MTVGVFIYGTLVFAIVCAALGLILWGIVNERRDRMSFEQGREVFGDPGAEFEASVDRKVPAR